MPLRYLVEKTIRQKGEKNKDSGKSRTATKYSAMFDNRPQKEMMQKEQSNKTGGKKLKGHIVEL